MTEAIPALAWWRDGEQALRATVAAIPDTALDQPSRLPGWTRQTLLAHVTRNADALVNLLAWASTGVPTPMYARRPPATPRSRRPRHCPPRTCARSSGPARRGSPPP
jgi:uncharacterized protein (TIGR03083 family)